MSNKFKNAFGMLFNPTHREKDSYGEIREKYEISSTKPERLSRIDSTYDIVLSNLEGCKPSLAMLTDLEIDELNFRYKDAFLAAKAAKQASTEKTKKSTERTYKKATDKFKDLTIEIHQNSLDRAIKRYKDAIDNLNDYDHKHDVLEFKDSKLTEEKVYQWLQDNNKQVLL